MHILHGRSQSLFYWITYSYKKYWGYRSILKIVSILILLDYLFLWGSFKAGLRGWYGLNPYFIGLPILILIYECFCYFLNGLNPYFIGLPILINYDIASSTTIRGSLNPYFIGLPILIRSVEKALYLLLLQNFFQTLKSTFF